MSKYSIPVAGWIIATWEWQRAYDNYNRLEHKTRHCPELAALWQAYDRTCDTFVVAMVTLAVAGLLVPPLLELLLNGW